MDSEKSLDAYKTYRLIFVEWITTIAVLLGCFGYLTYKIEKQPDRTDKLYEMFVSLQKETKEEIASVQNQTKDMFIELLKNKS